MREVKLLKAYTLNTNSLGASYFCNYPSAWLHKRKTALKIKDCISTFIPLILKAPALFAQLAGDKSNMANSESITLFTFIVSCSTTCTTKRLYINNKLRKHGVL